MKKIVFIFVLLFIGFIFQFKPIGNFSLASDLSSKEWIKYVKEAKENNMSALTNLYVYYEYLHKDMNGSFMVACKGASLEEKTFQSIVRRKIKYDNKLLCPEQPLEHLKDYSSWIPIEIRILWL